MKIAKSTICSGLIRRIGVGMTALALAMTFSLPTAALAKQKHSPPKVSKISVEKKVSKKLSKKSSKLKTLTKHAQATPKVTAKLKAKVTKRTVTSKRSKAASKSESHPSTPVASRKKAVRKVSKHQKQASHKRKQTHYAKSVPQPKHVSSSSRKTSAAKASDVSRDSTQSGKAHQVGTASYYNDSFDGRKTASGERFDQDSLTCAHGSLPFGCRIRVTNLRNNKAVEVKVNDRGGFSKHGRVIDLSKAAAKEIGMMGTGTAKVKVEVLE